VCDEEENILGSGLGKKQLVPSLGEIKFGPPTPKLYVGPVTI
jgi:hypothetical protein